LITSVIGRGQPRRHQATNALVLGEP